MIEAEIGVTWPGNKESTWVLELEKTRRWIPWYPQSGKKL
jgi:hypothetical protein